MCRLQLQALGSITGLLAYIRRPSAALVVVRALDVAGLLLRTLTACKEDLITRDSSIALGLYTR
jgi:hypothetical protein